MARDPSTQPLTYVTINDFSPGIYDTYADRFNDTTPLPTTLDKGVVVQPGAATIDDTFRCCADRSGALVPLPKLIAGKTSERLPTPDNDAAQYLSGNVASFLLDAMVRNEMFEYGEDDSADDDRTGVYVMYGHAYELTGESVFKWTVIAQLHRLFEGSTTQQHDVMFGRGTASFDALTGNDMPIGAGNFIPFRSRYESIQNRPADVVAWVAYGGPGFDQGSGTWASGTMSAEEQAITDYDAYTNTTLPGSHQRIIGAHPDPAFPSETASGFLGGTHLGPVDETFKEAALLIAHQGRMVALTRSLRRHGQNVNATNWGRIVEEVHYSPPQDFYGELGIGCFEIASWAEEKPYRTGAAASITADQLILIKDKGGAIMARGDLSQPTIVQLPYVESTHGARCIPALTPMGLVYGSVHGIHMWEGGETSRLISPQIDGWFWNHDPERFYLGNRGRMAWWNPFVCVPNNYIMDSRNNSWWRLDEPESTSTPSNAFVPFNVYDVAETSNRLYAFPYKLGSSELANPMWYTATPDILADTYSWQSQPIVESRLRIVSVQEVELVVTPASTAGATVEVTLTGFDADGNEVTPRVIPFTCSTNTNTQIIHKDVRDPDAELGNFQASNIQIKLVANSENTSIPAPKIHSVKITLNERARVAKS